jgi:hypothetical protein
MLTERAMYERRWGKTPFLGSVLHRIADEMVNSWYPTSITHDELEQLHEMLTVAAVVAPSHDALLKSISTEGDEEEMRRRAHAADAEIHRLADMMQSTAASISAEAKALRQLAAHLHADALDIIQQAELRRREASTDTLERPNTP